MTTELISLENLTPAVIFKEKGGDPIVEQIRKEVMAIDRDISTPEGRKNIASIAHKVARSKTFIDEIVNTIVCDSQIAELIVIAIAKGEVPNVKIFY